MQTYVRLTICFLGMIFGLVLLCCLKRAKYKSTVERKHYALIGLAIGCLFCFLMANLSTILGGTYNSQPLLHYVDPE